MISIDRLRVGQKGVIVEEMDAHIPVKLMEIGCLPGNEIELIQIAPLNDPMYFLVDGSRIAIRREMAQYVKIDLKS
ncbi:MAG: FeoA family protein [Flavobacteriaceae bacterium]